MHDFIPEIAGEHCKDDRCNAEHHPEILTPGKFIMYQFKFYKCKVNNDGIEELVLVPDSTLCLNSDLATAETRNIDVYRELDNKGALERKIESLTYRIYSYSQKNDSIIGAITAYYGIGNGDTLVHCTDKYIFIPDLEEDQDIKEKIDHKDVDLYFEIETGINTLSTNNEGDSLIGRHTLEVLSIKDRANNKFGGNRGVYYFVNDFLPALKLSSKIDTIPY